MNDPNAPEPEPSPQPNAPEPEEKPTGDEPATEPEPTTAEPPKEKAATLRQRKEQLETENKTLQARVKELETKSAEPPKELTEIQEKNAALEKRLGELEEEQRFTDYSKSNDYKQRYYETWLKSYQAGRNKVASLVVTDAQTGEQRQGKPEDFDAIMSIADDNVAADKAFDLFGNKTPVVLYHRERVSELNGQRLTALDEFRKTGGEREKARTEAMTKHRQQLADSFHAAIKEGETKFPQWAKADEADPKSAEFLETGLKYADIAFGKPETGADGKPVQRSPAELTKLQAAIRNKAAWFDHVVYQLNKANATNKALTRKLAQFESSEPGPGNGAPNPGRKPASLWDTVDADLQQRAR